MGDNQCILISECLDERLRLIVVDLLDRHAFRQVCVAVDARDGGDGMFARFEKGFGHEPATVATSLYVCYSMIYNWKRTIL